MDFLYILGWWVVGVMGIFYKMLYYYYHYTSMCLKLYFCVIYIKQPLNPPPTTHLMSQNGSLSSSVSLHKSMIVCVSIGDGLISQDGILQTLMSSKLTVDG